MQNHFYAVLSRMKNIYRWGLMRNTRRENLSEHSLETAFIAHALCIIGNERLGGDYDACFAATAAMFHDTTEIITGDMPTPIKYYNSEIKTAYKQIEAAAGKTLTDMLPDDFKKDFEKIYSPDENTARIIKAADKLSALIKCIEELNTGNLEFFDAEKTVRRAVKDMHCPEADIFLKEFIPSFSLSLDKQKEETEND